MLLQHCISLIYSAEVSLFFSIIPKHTDASLPFRRQFKISIITKISPLNSQPFMKSHLHFPIILQICDLPCCFSVLNCTTTFFVWAVKWCTCLIACQHLISIMTEFCKLVLRWGKCINIDGEYDEKWYFVGISDLQLNFVSSHWFSRLTKPYNCTFLVRFSNI
jgi:hypothetical protein